MNCNFDDIRRPSSVRFALQIALAFVVAFAATVQSASAATLVEQVKSLSFAPGDASFYVASLRMGDQWNRFRASRTYQKLMQMPVMQLAIMQLGFQWQQLQEPVVVQAREYLATPEGQETLAIVHEMASSEAFCYGNGDLAELLEFLVQVRGNVRRIQIEAAIAKQSEEEAKKKVFESLLERCKQLEIPEIVLGFKIDDAERADRQLNLLETFVTEQLNQLEPELAERLTREQVAGHDFLVWRLDGAMLPWDEFQNSGDITNLELFEQFKALVSGKNVVVAVGQRDGFLLTFVGHSTEPLENLGTVPLLAETPDFARLSRHADRPVISISYATAQLAQAVDSQRQNLTELVDLAEGALDSLEISDELRARTLADVRKFVDIFRQYLPSAGAASAIAYLTDRGTEGFMYRQGTLPMYDSSQPLKTLSHVGGNPLAFYAGHSKNSVASHNESVSAVKNLIRDAEEIGQQLAPPDDWDEYIAWRRKVFPFLSRWNAAIRDHLYPAFGGDFQTAIVIDAKAVSKHWINEIPPSEKDLPMLELGIVGKVAKPDELRTAIADVLAVVQDAFNLAHAENPEDIPELKIPAPEVGEISGGKTYTFRFPAELGIDEQSALNTALTESTWAASIFPGLTTRLIKATPLEIDTAIDVKRPAAVVCHVQFPRLLDAILPWIDYGFEVATRPSTDGENSEAAAASQMPAGFILPQVRQAFDVLSAIRSYTSVTYREDDVWVTHSELHVVDAE